MTKSRQHAQCVNRTYVLVIVELLKDSMQKKKRRMNICGYRVVLFIFLGKIVNIKDAFTFSMWSLEIAGIEATSQLQIKGHVLNHCHVLLRTTYRNQISRHVRMSSHTTVFVCHHYQPIFID
jgi:hypothetical protein